MQSTNSNISNLINLDENITFLVGAGCSIDPPTCLPSAKKMMKAIIDFICEKSYKDLISKYIDDIRFESLMGIIQKFYDKDLKILEYYNQSRFPNFQHYFFAKMIKQGKQVITTNYDCLIEQALINLGVIKEKIIPIITKKDFIMYKNPYVISKNGKFPLIKVHGSIENIITGELTKDSIKATIESLGENKKGIDIFKLEDFKLSTIQKVLNGKILIVMGYSGMDDFDIIPSLFTIKKYKKIIWIFHDYKISDSQIHTYEIIENSDIIQSNKITKLLYNFKKLGLVNKIFYVRANTSKLVEELLDKKPILHDQEFKLDLLTWLERSLKPIGELKKLYFPQKILLDKFEHKESLKIAKKLLKKSKLLLKNFWIWVALRNIGLIYHRRNKIKKAIRYHEMSLEIIKDLNDDLGKASTYANLGDVYAEIGESKRVFEFYGKADAIYKKYGDYNASIHLYHNTGMYFVEMKKNKKAKKFLRIAKNLVDESPDIFKKAKVYGSYANIIFEMGNYNKALYYYNKALEIVQNLNLLHFIGIYLGGLGMVQLKKERYDKALDRFFAAISIHKNEGDKKSLAIAYNNVAGVYYKYKDFKIAYKYSKKSYKLFKQMGMVYSPLARRIKKNLKEYKRKI